jgi:hypothetical protein
VATVHPAPWLRADSAVTMNDEGNPGADAGGKAAAHETNLRHSGS